MRLSEVAKSTGVSKGLPRQLIRTGRKAVMSSTPLKPAMQGAFRTPGLSKAPKAPMPARPRQASFGLPRNQF